MPEKIKLDDEKEYIEFSITELEEVRLQLEINRQLKTGRASVTKHHVFMSPSDTFNGMKMRRM